MNWMREVGSLVAARLLPVSLAAGLAHPFTAMQET
jgi:hypothetical protein